MKFKNVAMRKILFILIILSGCYGSWVFGQINTAVLADHPRIIFTTDDQQIYEKKIAQNDQLKSLHEIVLDYSGYLMDEPLLERVQVGRRILGISRDALRRIVFLSYSYRLTGEEKFLERAEKEMLAVSAFKDWNPSHFLDVAEMTAALAFGYDWLYNDLNASSKKIIREAIIEKGLKTSLDHDGWKYGNNNWNQVCNGGMVLGALAVYDEEPELARQMIERAQNTVVTPLEEYEPDGAYPEGPGYWGYGTSYHILLLSAMESAFGEPMGFEITDSFKKSAEYLLHMKGPNGFFNYCDCGIGYGIKPALYWMALQTDKNQLLWHQQKALDKFLLIKEKETIFRKLNHRRIFPLLIIWAAKMENLDIEKPTKHNWVGHGITPVATHRSSWDENAVFIGIKGGIANSHHAHMDAGTFVMDAQGIRWAIDLGGHPYHALESRGLQIWGKTQDAQRWQINRYSNYFHNTLTVDNKLHKVDGKAEIIMHDERESYSFTVVELSPVFEGQLASAKRGVALCDAGYVMVRDEVKNNNQQITIRWNMITHENVSVSGNEAVIEKDGKSMHVKILSPENAVFQTWTTNPDNDFEDKNPGTVRLGFEIETNAGGELQISVLLSPLKNQNGKILNKNLSEW
jgi:hypothetical protein